MQLSKALQGISKGMDAKVVFVVETTKLTSGSANREPCSVLILWTLDGKPLLLLRMFLKNLQLEQDTRPWSFNAFVQ